MVCKEAGAAGCLQRSAIAALCLALPAQLWALGLGEVRMQSQFAQPFAAQVQLLGDEIDALHPSCMRAQVMTLDGELLQQARIQLQAEQRRLLINAPSPLYEPALSLQVQLSCGQTVTRSWDVLLELPGTASPAPAVASARPPAPVALPALARAAVGPAPPTAVAAASASTSARLKLSHQTKAVSHPVLRLNVAQDVQQAAEIEQLVLAKALGLSAESLRKLQQGDAISADAASDAEGRQLAMLQQKIKMLEADADRLQRLSEQQDRQLASPAGPGHGAIWLAGLGVLLSLALLAISWLLWRVRALHQEAGRWRDLTLTPSRPATLPQERDTGPLAPPSAAPARTAPLIKPPAEPIPAVSPAAATPAEQPDETPMAFVGNLRQPPPEFEAATLQHPALFESGEEAAPARLQDLQQAGEITDVLHEAEFWVSLGKGDKAADLLEHAIGQDASTLPGAPAPWLYLLDLYRHLDREQDFQRCRARFKQHYNAHIPAWHEEASPKGPGLIDQRPDVCRRISLVWGSRQAIPFLHDLLRDDRAGQRHGFALDEYRELMFLLDLARTRAQMNEDEHIIEFTL